MKIQLKHSETLDNGQAVAPQAQYMLDGEVAVNMASADPRLFIKLSDDSIGNIPFIPAGSGGYLRTDGNSSFDGTITGGTLHLGGQIESSTSKLQVKGRIDTGNINVYSEVGGLPSTGTGKPLSNSAGTLLWDSNTVWTSSNDGAGSGLDADTLDGINSASFLRSDANDSFTGTLNEQYIHINGDGPNYIRFLDNGSSRLAFEFIFRIGHNKIGFENGAIGVDLNACL